MELKTWEKTPRMQQAYFPASSTIVDWGAGGGLPIIPSAICFPEVAVVGVDSVGKKGRAVRTMARRLALDNLYAWTRRAEEWEGEAHYLVSRATAPLAELWQWHEGVSVPLDEEPKESEWSPGLLAPRVGISATRLMRFATQIRTLRWNGVR